MIGVEILRNYYPSLVEAARATWPRADWPHWHKYSDANSVKYATKDPARVTAAVAELIRAMSILNVPEGCFPDLDLHGAGMHWIPEGGHLGSHIDAQRHPLTGWKRRCNAILYLDRCEGGELVIDGYGDVTPEPGLLLMFDTAIRHEVRRVTAGNRRSISLFWWSVEPISHQECDRSMFSVCRGKSPDDLTSTNIVDPQTGGRV